MSRASFDVLERNLEALLRRAWVPVVPRPAFRARLERELAPWIVDARPRRIVARPVLRFAAAALALLAALVCWRVLEDRFVDPARRSSDPGRELALLLGAGEVAVCELPENSWRAATAAERRSGIEQRTHGAALRLYTPAEWGIALRDGAGFEARLAPRSHARFDRGADRSELQLVFGAVELRSAARPAVLSAQQGTIELSDAALLVAFDCAGRASREDCAVLVDLLAGRAVLDAGSGPVELEAPRRARMESGVVQILDEPRPRTAEGDASGQRESLSDPAADGAPPPDEETKPATSLAALGGSVRDAESGEPIASFEVTLLRAVDLPRVSWPLTRSFADSAGRFRLDDLERGEYAVFVQAQGRAAWKQRPLVLAAGARQELDVLLGAGATARGYVVDRASGLPIAGALVLSESDAPAQVLSFSAAELPAEVRARTVTGADGSFELAHLGAGAQVLRASGPEHGCARSQSLSLGEGESVEGLLFELAPGGAIEGLVQGDGGAPWAGARVIAAETAARSGGQMGFGTALTDAQGRYAIRHLAPGYYVVLVSSDDASSEEISPEITAVVVEEGGIACANFLRATSNARVHGLVRDAAGAPLGGATVNLSRSGAAELEDWRASTTHEDGSYALEDVEPGPYDVHVGIGSGIVLQGSFEISAGEDLERDFRLVGSTLSGRVTDLATGGAAEGYVLLLVPHAEPNGSAIYPALDQLIGKSWTSSSIRYEFPFLQSRRYDLVAFDDVGRYAVQIVEDVAIFEGEDAELDLALLRGGSALVRVVDAARVPVEGARVELIDPHGRRLDFLETHTSPDGTTRIDGLEPGIWRLRASTEDGGVAERALQIDAEALREQVLELDR